MESRLFTSNKIYRMPCLIYMDRESITIANTLFMIFVLFINNAE